MGLIEPLKKIRDVGVPEDMPPEDAKYIRALNILVFLAWPPHLMWGLQALAQQRSVPAAVHFVWVALILSNYLIVSGRRYLVAKIFLIVLLNLHTVIAAVFIHGLYTDKWNLLFAALVPFIFSRKETRWMLAVIGFCLAAYYVKPALGQYFVPLYGMEYSGLEFGGDKTAVLVFYLVLVAAPAIYRQISIWSDERLQEEKSKVALLSEKLKVYLPAQFVESLARGERGAEPDYRRKRLTIFFSDVQGFTKWTDKLEPEEVREILNHYLSEMSAIACKWGGTIDKFIGDCLMIFFGDPEFTNDKDHAIRCVNMAMEMQEKMKELRQGWRKMAYDEPLNIRIGINTGWATVGNFGSEDRLNYTALGSAVNLASRIESACAPDKITISHTTRLLIEDEIDCQPKGEIEVKGFPEPIKIYEVVGIKPPTESADH